MRLLEPGASERETELQVLAMSGKRSHGPARALGAECSADGRCHFASLASMELCGPGDVAKVEPGGDFQGVDEEHFHVVVVHDSLGEGDSAVGGNRLGKWAYLTGYTLH